MNSEKISARDLIFSLILAKGASLAATYCFIGRDGNADYKNALSHIISLVIFFGLLLIATKQPALELLKITRLRNTTYGSSLIWLLISIPLGFLFRFGSEGFFLVVINVYDPPLAREEISNLIRICTNTSDKFWLLTLLVIIIAALDEEFVYRRIFQWHFCTRYNAIRGIVTVSLIFGAIHLNPAAALAALCLGFIYVVSGRLWVAITAHAAGNLFHPLLRAHTCATNFDSYLTLSAIAALVLSVLIIFSILKIRTIAPLYKDSCP